MNIKQGTLNVEGVRPQFLKVPCSRFNPKTDFHHQGTKDTKEAGEEVFWFFWFPYPVLVFLVSWWLFPGAVCEFVQSARVEKTRGLLP